MGLQRYLARFVIPVLVGNLRRAQLTQAFYPAVNVARVAPFALLFGLARYYFSRAKKRLGGFST